MAIQHPAHYITHDSAADVIEAFRVGTVEQPSPEALAADQRIAAALALLADDIALVRQWHGGVSHHRMVSKVVNPEIPDELMEEFKQAALAGHPGLVFSDMWKNLSNGINGVSIRLSKGAQA